MTTFDDACHDYDEATDALLQARWQPDVVAAQRQALNAAMGCLFRLRNYRRRQYPSASGELYWDAVKASVAGRTVEALVLVRGLGEHDFTRDVEPRRDFAYPSETTFPSTDMFADDRNLFWRSRASLGYDFTEQAAGQSREQLGLRVTDYDGLLAGQEVISTLRAARPFIVGVQ